jgi:uncharacterized membrane protein
MPLQRSCAVLAAACLSVIATTISAAPRYHLIDLGKNTGADVLTASDRGEIAGDDYDPQERQFRAAKFRQGVWKIVRDDGYGSAAFGIDHHGSLVGATYDKDDVDYPTYWPKHGPRQVIQVPYDVRYGEANAISPEGAYIVGTGYPGNIWPRCFFWTGSGIAVDLGTLGGDSCLPFAVNDAGVVGGLSNVKAGASGHAMIYDQEGMHDLGVLRGGHFSKIVALNSNAHGVGEGEIGSSLYAIYWDGSRLINLGTLGGDYSTAVSINDSDDIVGVARDAQQNDHAFLYTSGKLLALDTLVDNGAGWNLIYADQGPVSIGSTGIVVGEGEYQDEPHLYKLVPVAR